MHGTDKWSVNATGTSIYLARLLTDGDKTELDITEKITYGEAKGLTQGTGNLGAVPSGILSLVCSIMNGH